MRRREFIALAGASIAWPFAALAQEPGRTYRLGCLFNSPRGNEPQDIAFFNELRRGGFIEGQNLTVEYRVYGKQLDLIPRYAAELVNARVDVIAAESNDAVRAVQQATKTIPIVGVAGDMLGLGFVNSLSRPDGNTTGVNILADEADGKRQDILIEAVPGLRLLAVLAHAEDHNAAKLEALQKAAHAHNVEFSIHRVAKGKEIAAAIDSAQASGATALNIIFSSPLFYVNRRLIIDRTVAAHLPTIWELAEIAQEGGFAAYGPRRSDLYEIMAQGTIVSKEQFGETTRRAFLGTATVATAASLTAPSASHAESAAQREAAGTIKLAEANADVPAELTARAKAGDWTKPAAMAIPKEGYFKLEQGRYGPIFPKTPANYGFTLIAKIKPGREETIRAYGKTIENAIAGNPSALAPLRLHYLRWVLFNIGGETYFMYQGIFDTDFDKYTEDAVALFTSLGVSTTFENLEGFPMDWKTNAPAFIKFVREHQCPSFLEYGEYPFVTADEIKKALKVKQALSAMLDQMQ